MPFDVVEIRDFAEQLARTSAVRVAGDRARMAGAAPLPRADTKSSSTDYVTDLDRESERCIRRMVADERPQDTVLGEEEGGGPGEPGRIRWVVDPVDGTTNLRYGIPVYAVSIAAQVDGVTIAGAVAEPATGRVWSAGLGEGSRLHDPRLGDGWLDIRAGSTTELTQVLLGTGFSYDANERVAQGAVLGRVIGQINDLRRAGSAAVDLCWVAAGLLDAYFEHHLNVWDWAAGALIAEEAGAVVHLPGTSGVASRLGDPVFAAAPGIADDLIDELVGAGAAYLRDGNDALVRAIPDVLPPTRSA